MGRHQREECGRKILLTARDRAVIAAAYDPQPAAWLKPTFIEMTKKKDNRHTVSDQAFYRRLSRLCRTKHLHIVGRVADGDRYVNLVCSQKFKADNAEHEFSLTKLLRAWNVRGTRGKDVDPVLLPDATIADGIHVEMDMGHVPLPRVETRMHKYGGCTAPMLFVTTTERHKMSVLRRCPFLSGTLLACTLEDALRDKRDVILTDVRGRKTSFRRVLSRVLNEVLSTQQGAPA